MSFDASFWVSLSFFIFIFLAYKPIKNIILTSLDKRIQKIRIELEEMNNLKQEAIETLDQYKKRQKIVEKEIEEIIQNAQLEISKMQQTYEKEVATYLNKRTSQIMDKILSHEAEVMQNLRCEAIETTTRVLDQIIKENLSKNKSQELVKSSINDISKIFQ